MNCRGNLRTSSRLVADAAPAVANAITFAPAVVAPTRSYGVGTGAPPLPFVIALLVDSAIDSLAIAFYILNHLLPIPILWHPRIFLLGKVNQSFCYIPIPSHKSQKSVL